MISAFAWWALGGVAGVGVIAALIVLSVGRLQSRADHLLPAAAWLMVAAGAVLELVAAARWSAGPHGIGGALVVAGVLVVVHAVATGPDVEARRTLLLILLVVPLFAAAAVLPGTVWKLVYGLVLIAAAAWLASATTGRAPRLVFACSTLMLAGAAAALVAGALVPRWNTTADFVAAVLLLLGLTALAAAHITSRLASETEALRSELSTLEDEHEHLLRLAETDPLTGCPNRQALRAWFDRWEGGEPVSVVLVDVDGLKRINEKHGQDAGDDALKLVAGVLSSSIRPGDLVVRWGGDEFVALLRGAGHEAAQRRFTGLIASLQDRAGEFPYDEPLAVQWGVSTCASADDIARALAEADDRMYAMKRRQASTD